MVWQNALIEYILSHPVFIYLTLWVHFVPPCFYLLDSMSTCCPTLFLFTWLYEYILSHPVFIYLTLWVYFVSPCFYLHDSLSIFCPTLFLFTWLYEYILSHPVVIYLTLWVHVVPPCFILVGSFKRCYIAMLYCYSVNVYLNKVSTTNNLFLKF